MLDTAWPPGEDFGLYPTLGAMYECRRNYDIQHSSVKYTESSAYSAYLRMQELRPPLVAVTRVLERRIAEAPALPQTVILPEVAKEEIVERGMLPAATWYLHEWDGEVTPDFITHMRALEATRAEESLLPEEQRILGWMQLAYAQHLAVQAEGDSAQLVTAREQFKAAIDTFMRAVKGFERSQQAGDVIDALLTLEASQAYRALYTSSDKYAIKKQITAYTEKVAELFLLIRDRAAGLEAADEQMQVITASMERILLCLLQTAAEDEFERRVVVPARLNTQGDVIAYVSESTERAVTYDVDRQVVIHIVDGNEIKAKPHQVFIGRDMLGEPEELLAMLGEIAATIIPIEQAQPAGKKAKGGKATRKPVRLPTRSDKTNQLAEAIWYKIFDAAEGVDDDIQE
jgi:hypothetical protein